jgi:tRNA dimethylallyltransferase
MDYESYKTIDINNHRRVIRVLSVCIDSGLKYSSFLSKEKKIRKFQSQIYILCEERIKIYDKINERVDKMVENGLEKEAKSLYKFKDSKIFETVGYKEWILYWNRTLSKKKTIEEIKKNTRRYAKRQITWFKKYKKATWLKPNEAIDKILKNYM